MLSSRKLGLSMFLICACAAQVHAGWVIDQVEKGRTDGSKQQIMLQANQMKTVLLGPDGKPESAFIMDLNTELFTQVDYRKQTYVSATVAQYVQTIQQAMKKATTAMEEAMKTMPAEQRKAMEKMLGSRLPQAGSNPEACPERKMEVKKVGQQATIAGFPAINYEISVDGKTETELWITKEITAWKELDPKKLEHTMSEFSKAVPRCGSFPGRQPGMGSDQAWKLVSEGYPVRTVDRAGSGATMEVVKAEHRAVLASEFQPPADFTAKKLTDVMGREKAN
jgi:hypothetical protein